MSVLDQVRALEQQVLQRLRELRPLVDEYRDLEQVAERLGLKRDDEQPTEAGAKAIKANPQRLEAWLVGVTTFDGKPGLDAVKEKLGL